MVATTNGKINEIPFFFIDSFCDRINADKFIVGKTPLEQLLTRNTDQQIKGAVKVHGNIFVSNGTNMALNHVLLDNRIFDVNLQELLDDSYHPGPDESIQIDTDKWFHNLTVRQLTFETDFWHQNASTEEIHARVRNALKSVTLTGPQTFSNQFEIDELIVNSMINGIPIPELQSAWLLTSGDQVNQIWID